MMPLLLGVMLALFAIGVPVAFAMVLSAIVAFLSLGDVPLMVLPQRILTGADSFPLMAIPLFLLAGNLMIGGGFLASCCPVGRGGTGGGGGGNPAQMFL